MTTSQDRKQALVEHTVITDVLPGELDLVYDLTLKWPHATVETSGKELDYEDTKSEPKLFLSPAVRISGRGICLHVQISD
jgi:hypothetical protein